MSTPHATEKAKGYVLACQSRITGDVPVQKNLIHCKDAVYAGFTTLPREAGMDFCIGDRMIITGGLGQYLNIEKAVTIVLFDTGIHERLNKLSLEQKKSDK